MKRINYIDTMKAMGITLVVLGHAAWLNGDFYTLIYSFHMPLFFFLSGYLASSKREVKLSLVKLFQRLILPFTFFFLISYLFWLPLNIFSDGQASKMEWFDPLNRLVTSKADSFHINGVLWFFPCLIIISLAQIIFFSALKPIYNFVITSGMLVIMLLFNELISERWFWSIDSAVVGMFFYQLGVLVKRVNFLSYAMFNNEFKIYLILLFTIPIFYYLALLNGRVDIRELKFGVFPILFPLIACLGIFILFLISKKLKPRPTYQWLAISSIVIFPLHLIVFRFLHKIEVRIIPNTWHLFDLLPYVNTLIAIFFLVFVFRFIKSQAPKLIGLSN